jgi:hypothetical protein
MQSAHPTFRKQYLSAMFFSQPYPIFSGSAGQVAGQYRDHFALQG